MDFPAFYSRASSTLEGFSAFGSQGFSYTLKTLYSRASSTLDSCQPLRVRTISLRARGGPYKA